MFCFLLVIYGVRVGVDDDDDDDDNDGDDRELCIGRDERKKGIFVCSLFS